MKPILLAAAALMFVATHQAAAQSFVLVVNAKNPVRELTRDQAARLFLKKVVKWSDGSAVEPVDQEKSSRAREAFTQRVLTRSVDAVEIYWQAQIYAGKDLPPTIKRTDSDVLTFVSNDERAIGYVSSGASLPSDVRVVPISGT